MRAVAGGKLRFVMVFWMRWVCWARIHLPFCWWRLMMSFRRHWAAWVEKQQALRRGILLGTFTDGAKRSGFDAHVCYETKEFVRNSGFGFSEMVLKEKSRWSWSCPERCGDGKNRAPPIVAEQVLPHKAPMALLGHVIAHDSNPRSASFRIGPETLFLEKDRVDARSIWNLSAQTIARMPRWSPGAGVSRPKLGFYWERERRIFLRPGIAGSNADISAKHVWGEGDLFSFDCSVRKRRARKKCWPRRS